MDSAIDLLKAGEKTIILAYNDSAADRHSLSLALSEDDGKSRHSSTRIDGGEGEYSYPSLTADGSGKIHMSYTEDRYRIKHVQFDIEWLRTKRTEKPFYSG